MKTCFYIVLCLTLVNCKSSNSQNKINQDEGVALIKMGFIKYESADNSDTGKQMAELMVQMMKTSLEYEVVYNSKKVAEVRYNEESSEIISEVIYDIEANLLTEIMYTESGNYYTQTNYDDLLSNIPASTEDEKSELSKMFNIDKSKEAQKEIFGFKCTKLTMMDPDNPNEEYFTAYMTDKIPWITNSMGELAQYMHGMPLETSVNINGVKIYYGALSHEYNNEKINHLDVDYLKFQKLSNEEFEILKNR